MNATQQPGSPPSGGQPGPDEPPAGPRTTAQDTADRVADGVRRLRRSRGDRLVAGVAGGVARSLGLDPLLVRIVLAVLVVFGGAGVVLYAIGWLLLPVDDGEASVGARAVRTGPGRADGSTVLLAIVLTVVACTSVVWGPGHWNGGVLFVLAVLAVVVLLLQQDRAGRPAGAASGGSIGPVGPVGPDAGPPAATAPVPTSAPTSAAMTTAPVSLDKPVAGPAGATEPLLAPRDPARPRQPLPPPLPARPPRPPRERSVLGRVTVSLALILVGVLVAVDLGGADVPGVTYVAAPLALVGLALVVGTFVGRARGLIALGILLVLASAAGVTGQRVADGLGWDGRTSTVSLTPTSVQELPADAELRPGRATYDLTDLSLTGGQSPDMSAHIGAGEITVVVPHDMKVDVDAETGFGQVTVFGQQAGGPGAKLQLVDDGDAPATSTAGTLMLHLEAGFGQVEVRRAAA